MLIFVRTFSLSKEECLSLEVQLSDTIENIKDRIFNNIGFQNTIILYLNIILVTRNQYIVFYTVIVF